MVIRTKNTLLSTVAVLTANLALSATAFAQSAPAVIVTVENAQPSRGIFLTPPWLGIHDGSFDTYDGGQVASFPLGGDEIERLAEDGDNGAISATFASRLPNSPQVTGLAGPSGPLAPGDKASLVFRVDPSTDRYFSYASMIIPSNDFFIANGNPLAHELFDESGDFVGADFIVSGDETNDAGTERDDEVAQNVAFLNQTAPNTGVTENLPVTTPAAGFAAPGVLAYPNGVLNYPVFGNGDFNDADDGLFKVSFRYVDLGGNVSFTSTLSADQEVSSEIVQSDGRGSANLTARFDQQVRINVRANRLTGPVVAAHLHLGQAGSNGPIVVNLASGIRNNNVRLTIGESDLTGPLSDAGLAGLIDELAAGNIYINLHTDAFPAGELRGQVELR